MRKQSEILSIPSLKVLWKDDNGGYGVITVLGTPGSVVWSFKDDHVSFSPMKKTHTPTWQEMCELKDKFYQDNETAYQIHPPKSQYVNLVDNCLHLWGNLEKSR